MARCGVVRHGLVCLGRKGLYRRGQAGTGLACIVVDRQACIG